MKIQLIIIFASVFGLTSCFNILTEKETSIIGNISVIEPNNQEDKGCKLVIYQKDFSSSLFEDYVNVLDGNDTLLILKAMKKEYCNDIFYRIKHEKGVEIKDVITIPQMIYENLIASRKWKYHFESDVNPCTN